jgi:hypothetical protein
MPGIHFAAVRSAIPRSDVLRLVGFVAWGRSGDQVRGPCPVHRSRSSASRSFSVSQRNPVYRSFTWGSLWNQLYLYGSATGLTVYEAAIAVCEQLHREIPWTESARSKPPQSRPGTGPHVSRCLARRFARPPRRWLNPGRENGSIPGSWPRLTGGQWRSSFVGSLGRLLPAQGLTPRSQPLQARSVTHAHVLFQAACL